MSDFNAAIANIGNTRDPVHERYLVEAKETALKKLESRARELGANAVVGVDLDYGERRGEGSGRPGSNIHPAKE